MNTTKKYYGFKYYANVNTTYGTPNLKTGRYSIAGDLKVFDNKESLIEWLNGPGNRIQISKRKARSLCLGISLEEFNNAINGAYNI